MGGDGARALGKFAGLILLELTVQDVFLEVVLM